MKTKIKIMKVLLSGILMNLLFSTNSFSQAPLIFNYQAVLRDATGNLRVNTPVNIEISILSENASGTEVFSETHSATTNSFGLINLGIGSVNPAGFANIDWADGPYYIQLSVDGIEMGTSQLLSVPYALHAKIAENVVEGVSETDPVFSSSPSANITTGDITHLSNLSGTNTGDQDLSTLATKTALGDSIALVRNEITGEMQTITLSSNQLTISGTGGNTVTYTKWDTDTTNDVTISGDQTIYGSKSFISILKAFGGINMHNNTIANLAEPVNNQDAATKAYVDALMEKVEDLEGLLSGTNISDIDGNIYDLVTIGEQVWMAENLRTTKLNDGTPITLVNHLYQEWRPNNGSYGKTVPMVCWYDYQPANKNIYGGLYNRFCVQRNICPTGWHVPSADEWEILLRYIHDMPSHVGPGGQMKSTGTLEKGDGLWHQNYYQDRTTNETGFTGHPGGFVNDHGDRFEQLGYKGNWWGYHIGSHYEEEFSVVELRHDGDGVESNVVSRSANPGYSVRCVKDN